MKNICRFLTNVDRSYVPLLQYSYSAVVDEYNAMVYVKRRDTFHVDSAPDLYGTF